MAESQPKLSDLENQKLVAEELNRIFDYHAPTPYIAKLHEGWRTAVKQFATALMDLPPTRERAMAITRIEEAAAWIHACIARNHEAFPEPNDPPEEPESDTAAQARSEAARDAGG